MIPEIRLKRKRSARDGTPNWYEVMVAELVSWRHNTPGKSREKWHEDPRKTMENHGKMAFKAEILVDLACGNGYS
jgi:hypothetical protein